MTRDTEKLASPEALDQDEERVINIFFLYNFSKKDMHQL